MVSNVHAWHPPVPALREVYHAAFEHAYPMHAHDVWTVILVDEGAVSYSVDRSGHIAAPGAVTLLPPGVPHDGRSTVDGRIYRKRVLYLDGDWLPADAADRAVAHPTLPGMRAVTAVRGIQDALAAPGDLLAAEDRLLRLRARVLAHLGADGRSRRDVPLARRLRSLLDERFTESFTLGEIAGALGVHPSHLTRAFSQAYGLAPHQYVLSRRLDLARRLLVDGSRPVDAAAEAGFHDQAHLTRHFRRVLGATPGAFSVAARGR